MNYIILDRNENRITNCKGFDSKRKIKLNGLDTLEFTTFDNHLEKYFRILYKDKRDKWREFIVISVEEIHSVDGIEYRVYAENSLTETKGNFIEDKRITDNTFDVAASRALEDTRWIVLGDKGGKLKNCNFYRISVFEAISKIIDTWNCEIDTEIEVSQTGVSSRTVYFRKQVGMDNGKRFTWSKDLERIERKVEEDEIITALYGFGKGEMTESGGYGRRIDFSELNNGLMYVSDDLLKEAYGIGKPGQKMHRFGVVIYEDIEDKQELLDVTINEFELLSKPRVTYRTSVIDLESYGIPFHDIDIGDYVGIRDKELDLTIKARVTEIEEDPDNIDETVLTIGNYQENYSSQLGKLVNNTVRDKVDTATSELADTIVRVSADGNNRIISSTVEPTPQDMDLKVNDLLYLDKGNGEIELKFWNGAGWQLIIDTFRITQAEQDVNSAKQTAETAQQKADDLFTQVDTVSGDLDTTKTNLNEIRNTVDINKQTLTQVNTNITNLENITTKIHKTVRPFEYKKGELWAKPEFNVDDLQQFSMTSDMANHTLVEILASGVWECIADEATNFKWGDWKCISVSPLGIAEDYSTITQTINSIESEVYNSDGTSKITQLSSQITSRVTQDELNTAITQTKDFIGLRVKNDNTGGVTWLTLNDGSILMSVNNNKIYLNDEYFYVENDLITNRMVASDISADKITTGTLDGREVNVIFLNASAITTGTISGTQGSWNLDTGRFENGYSTGNRVVIQNGKLETYYGNNKFAELNGYGLDFYYTGARRGRIGSSDWVNGNPNLHFTHYENNSMSLSYSIPTENQHKPYIIFDKYNKSGALTLANYPIQFQERALFKEPIIIKEIIIDNPHVSNVITATLGIEWVSLGDGNSGIFIGNRGSRNGLGISRRGDIYRVKGGTWELL